jgi:hypothetical protein
LPLLHLLKVWSLRQTRRGSVPYLRPNSIKAGAGFIEETRYEFKSFVRLLEFRGL